ncbi:hypothetical protein VA596_24495 [Amycolatopsis sp., V23-08]|uniref:Uncharacterized protein n=1 Tax=Amycolatopsis heterodermiae TaxID=3110235 RepID=A0ABU5R9B3_9PSEU|nr:hypothetical protein [Amycolatopsis sp., V23-08]MEA5362718.1 hypothetical protein [Amycolatopsis sp., V23-08]
MVKKVVLAAVVALLFAALLYLGGGKVSLDENTLLGTGCAIPSRITAVPGPADAAPGGGGIRVAEVSPSGAVLENTSTQVAYRIPVGPSVVPLLTSGARIGVATGGVLGQVTWLTPESLGGFTPVTATVVPGGVRFHSSNCRALTSRGGAALRRDAGGRIVGADQLPAASVSCVPGDHELPASLGAGTEVYPYCDL